METKKLLPPQPHTVSDWDFQTGTQKTLDATYYVSSPKSLKLINTAVEPVRPNLLCRIAETLCIPQGELRTWQRSSIRTRDFYLNFRNQAPLGSANASNTYRWSITGDWAYLNRIIADASVNIGYFPVYWLSNVWTHWRTLFWNGANDLGDPALAVELYVEEGGLWVKKGVTLYDTLNQWKDSVINRLGLGAWVNGANHWFDDTEIWGPVP